MTDGTLIALVIALLAVLVVVQLLSAVAAHRLGGKSSRGVITLRVVNAVGVTALILWLLIDRFGG
ncbi:MAG: hypothetical protein JXE06_09425 [Coriobacteriia bacterium]|nr:hypothetical protein [Coriobacteriia bacterium]MBN2821901.1 hypothetical protein [Coriobacteriia bacterium]